MKAIGWLLFCVLFAALLFVGYDYYRRQERDFQNAVLSELADLKKLHGQLEHHRRMEKLGERVLVLGGGDKAYWQAATEQCKAGSSLRKGLETTEKKVRDRYSGTLPLWLTQNRDWQNVDTEAKKGLPVISEVECEKNYTDNSRRGVGKKTR